ncbi:MAG: DMT family transporter [Bryobacteraceae bacterium]|nr:DMT family transporter [Bryobacteraceae bacterium]
MRVEGRLPRWLAYCLACLFLWGVWGVLAKVASGRMSPKDEQILFTAGSLPVAAAALWRLKGALETHRIGALCGVLNGVFAGLGLIAYYVAMERGPASVVAPVTALFPLLTVLLAATFLRERVNRFQAAGIAAALVSIFLLAS